MARFLSTSMNANICNPKDIHVMSMAQRYHVMRVAQRYPCYESAEESAKERKI